jgi:hypothetical protein
MEGSLSTIRDCAYANRLLTFCPRQTALGTTLAMNTNSETQRGQLRPRRRASDTDGAVRGKATNASEKSRQQTFARHRSFQTCRFVLSHSFPNALVASFKGEWNEPTIVNASRRRFRVRVV